MLSAYEGNSIADAFLHGINGYAVPDNGSSNFDKNAFNMLNFLKNPDTNKHVRVSFCGSVVCGYIGNTPTNIVYGTAMISTKKSIICCEYCYPENLELKINTIVHEFGHFLGVSDHYLCHAPLDSNMSDDCIWGFNHLDYDIYSENIICDHCHKEIRDKLDLFYSQSWGD